MQKKLVIIGLLFFTVLETVSAQRFFGLEVDNDLYFQKDYYYSSGINLKYGLKNQHSNRYHLFTLGQEVYNPSFRYATELRKIDYPYSGWLHLSWDRFSSQENNSQSWGIDLGVTGDASGAKMLQNWYHITFLNLEELSWVNQMPQKFLANIRYTKSNEWNIASDVRFSTKMMGQLGTQKTFVGLRTLLSFNTYSLLDDENPLRNTASTSGFFMGVHQELIAHDFAVNGPLDDSNEYELPLNPYRVIFMAGAQLKTPKWLLKGTWYYRSADNSAQRHPWHPYLGFTVYRFVN